MNDEQIRTIFINIANGIGGHGSFLTSYAKSVIKADAGNFALLRTASQEIIKSYNLNQEQYLKSE